MPKILIRHPSGMDICYQADQVAVENGVVRMTHASIAYAVQEDGVAIEALPPAGHAQNPIVDRWFWPEPGTTVWELPDVSHGPLPF